MWGLVRAQHGVVSRGQLLRLGFSSDSIHHRIERGRLHPVFRGVYAVGRPELSRHGHWMAAVLACGQDAFLSHEAAAALWGIRADRGQIAVTASGVRRHPGITVHRRTGITAAERHRIPVTTPTDTLIDLAARLPRDEIEAALNEADLRRLIDLQVLRQTLGTMRARPGVGKLRTTIDRRTFTFTRSRLERHFLALVRALGLPKPLTRVYVNGFEVDFFWPHLGLVIETDGGAFHRTPAQQAADRRRDQAHTAAGLTVLRFTHGQIRYEPAHVADTLRTVANRLSPVPA